MTDACMGPEHLGSFLEMRQFSKALRNFRNLQYFLKTLTLTGAGRP